MKETPRCLCCDKSSVRQTSSCCGVCLRIACCAIPAQGHDAVAKRCSGAWRSQTSGQQGRLCALLRQRDESTCRTGLTGKFQGVVLCVGSAPMTNRPVTGWCRVAEQPHSVTTVRRVLHPRAGRRDRNGGETLHKPRSGNLRTDPPWKRPVVCHAQFPDRLQGQLRTRHRVHGTVFTLLCSRYWAQIAAAISGASRSDSDNAGTGDRQPPAAARPERGEPENRRQILAPRKLPVHSVRQTPGGRA